LSSADSPVFYDPAGRRWKRVRRTWMALAVIVTSLAAVLTASVLVNPALPSLNIRPVASLPHSADIKPKALPAPANPSQQKAKKAQADLQHALAVTPRVLPARRRSHTAVLPPPTLPAPALPISRPLSIGFYINWDESSYESLKRNLDHLDWVIAEWSHVQDTANGAGPLATDVDAPALNWIRQARPQVQVIPMVQNLIDEKWNSDVLAQVVGDEASRQKLIAALTVFVETNKFAGVCVDFEEPTLATQPALLTFVQELHSAFGSKGLLVVQAVPFADPGWNYKSYAAANDYTMLMAYDQHYSVSDPGTIAAQDWYENNLMQRMRELDPARTIIALGNYGYDWTAGKQEAAELTFQEAVISARDSEAKIVFDPASRTPTFEYDDEDESHHSVWFLDAVTAYNQMRAASGFRPAGFAIWRLGSEDPSVWSLLGGTPATSADTLKRIVYGYQVDFEGTGEILKVVSRPQDGWRNLDVDAADGYVRNEDFVAIPSSYVIERGGDHPGLIALTFDDGPDPRWTPAILDILKQENVPATFFVIGKNGQAYPDLLRRLVNEGHEIGNHTYTHPNLGEIPNSLTELELNATQRLIESETGRSTVLFRPPYFGDAEADKPQEVEPAYLAQQLGYLMVGVRIDPDDWELPVTADQIISRTLARVDDNNPDTRGQIVLLHDSGGDRTATIAALPELIRKLKARGFRFVPVSDLAGLSRDQVMPLIPPRERVLTRSNAVSFFFLSTMGWILQWIFVIGIVLGLGRLIFIGTLALAQWLRSRRRERRHAGAEYSPFVSVIVPAYNEELVIANTINSLLASDYENYEIVVVDDGSTDKTSAVVRSSFSADARIRLFSEPNAGKAAALNTGLKHSQGEIVIALDADTLFAPQTIGALAHRFSDPQMGAVAGNAKVGNRINIVTRWQALEYITSQNMDRRAFASLNCITVVPGAVGAWRRDLITQAGGFQSDTLAEDQDLTLSIRRMGHNIGYEEDAIAWTEAPDRLSTLAKQRFRWAFGTLQCMRKHVDALFRPRYGALGFVALPNVWIFQILFPLISPVMDLMLVYTLLVAGLDRLQQPVGYSSTALRQVLFYYALFLAIDWVAASFAFLLEKKEHWRLLWWLFLQRFCYRQVMYYVMIKSVAVAARGSTVGWGKLDRKATAEAQ
jgi:cellulose synthase/poly-beta-1,6-N-acetylglucosamine synthase-like glycosyltransferase/peptidoglycan/xylan/chitin deacetylase (PgdA/CDA1 family)/spore germination protein YaaH